jgi:O-antigen/teichoic acid export membrane protein
MTAARGKTGRRSFGSFRSDVLISVVGTAGGQAINILAIPFLARLYSPADFGIWALYLVATSVLSIVITLRLDIPVVAARTAKTASSVLLFASCLAIMAALTMESALLIWWALAGPDGNANMAWLAWAPLGIGATALYAVFSSWWLRSGSLSRITAARIAFPLFSISLQFLWYQWPNGMGLVAGNCLAQTVTSLAVGALIFPEVKQHFHIRDFALQSLALLSRYRRIALYTTPYSLQGQAFRQIVIVILAGYASVAASGSFAMAQRIVYNPLTVVAAALEQAIYPRMAHAPADHTTHQLIARVMMAFSALLAAGCAFITVFADRLVPLLLGTDWVSSTPYLVAMAYASASMVASSWIVRVFDLFGYQRLHLLVDLGANVLIIAAFLLALLSTGSPVWAVWALAIGMTIYYMGWAVLAFRVSRMDVRPLAKILLLSVTSWLVTLVACLGLVRALGIS